MEASGFFVGPIRFFLWEENKLGSWTLLSGKHRIAGFSAWLEDIATHKRIPEMPYDEHPDRVVQAGTHAFEMKDVSNMSGS